MNIMVKVCVENFEGSSLLALFSMHQSSIVYVALLHQIKLIIGSDKLGFRDRGKAEYLGTKLLGIREKTKTNSTHTFISSRLQTYSPLIGGKWLALLPQNMKNLLDNK